jgi:hypothetical protein
MKTGTRKSRVSSGGIGVDVLASESGADNLSFHVTIDIL